jgi:hypothetical protein
MGPEQAASLVDYSDGTEPLVKIVGAASGETALNH